MNGGTTTSISLNSNSPRFGAMFAARGASGSLVGKLRESEVAVQSALTRIGGQDVTIYATGDSDVLTLNSTQGSPEELGKLGQKLVPSGKAEDLPTAQQVYNRLANHPVAQADLEDAGFLDIPTNRDKGYYFKLLPWETEKKA